MERREFIARVGATTIPIGLAGCIGVLDSEPTPTPTEPPVRTEPPNAPTAAFDFDYGNETITITHSSGNRIDPERLFVRINDAGLSKYVRFDRGAGGQINGDSIAAGDYIEIDASGTSGGEAAVRVIWEAGDSSMTIDEATLEL